MHSSVPPRACRGASVCVCVCVPCAGGVIRIKGRNLTESEHIKLGAYHSLELEQGRAFTLTKARWRGRSKEEQRGAQRRREEQGGAKRRREKG
jgi:hypothetical protein